MLNFETIKAKYAWSEIRNCPGRYLLRESGTNLTPEDIAGSETQFSSHEVEKAKDRVIVGKLEDGGLISYLKPDGKYLHTLNTIEGFHRKLQELGIEIAD